MIEFCELINCVVNVFFFLYLNKVVVFDFFKKMKYILNLLLYDFFLRYSLRILFILVLYVLYLYKFCGNL